MCICIFSPKFQACLNFAYVFFVFFFLSFKAVKVLNKFNNVQSAIDLYEGRGKGRLGRQEVCCAGKGDAYFGH